MQSTRSSKSVYVAIFLVLLFWAALGTAVFGRNAVFDWWRLRDYVPPAAVVQLADDTTMSDDAKRLFYAYHPSVESSETFNTHCRDNEFTIVLGCYIQYKGIYIFDIDDPRLEGVQQVTAAHELLHAAYDRLSNGERDRIDTLTAQVYEDLQDDRIRKTVEQYREDDPSSVPNELHSILATEVRDLPDELEEHYALYFADRSKIVAYSEKYDAAFESRTTQIESLGKEIDKLKADIEYANRELESQGTYLNEEGSRLQQRANNGQATDQEIAAFNRSVDEYNDEIARVNRLIKTFNTKREQYNALVGEQEELMQEIDSRPVQSAR